MFPKILGYKTIPSAVVILIVIVSKMFEVVWLKNIRGTVSTNSGIFF